MANIGQVCESDLRKRECQKCKVVRTVSSLVKTEGGYKCPRCIDLKTIFDTKL